MPFRDVVGHRALVSLLARSIARDSLPPSLIFAGPAGIGKRLLALALAQATNCPTPIDVVHPGRADTRGVDACGQCASCLRIARGVHPDVIVLAPDDKGSIRVEPVRDLIDRVGYRPFEGRTRVVVINDADALVNSAQNSLLKTLEEPPSASVFILVTSRPDLLLPTVQSRCPRLRFQPLTASEVAQVLVRSGASEPDARAIAATADGSVERALAEDAAELVESRAIAVRVLAQALMTDDARRRVEIAKELVAKTGGGGASDRQLLSSHLRMMSSLIRDAQLLGGGGDRASLANTDLAATLGKMTELTGERAERAFAAVDKGLAALERNAGVKTVADWVTLNL